MTRQKQEITIEVPGEFLELCRFDQVSPVDVLRGFVTDLCSFGGWQLEGYESNGHISTDRDRACAYYDHAYAWNARWIRDNVARIA